MDVLLVYRIALILILAFIYMLFDIFNNRNVPSVFAYATVVIGVVMTLLYYPNIQAIEISGLIALIVASVGYLTYKAGQLGAADVIELTAISLMLPIQNAPYLVAINQFGTPFIISVFIATGVVALLMIPLYYLPRAKMMLKTSILKSIGRKEIYKSALLATGYVVFIGFLAYALPIGYIGIGIMLVVMFSSLVTALFEKPITNSMIEYVAPEKFEEGDIIATNLMSKPEINAMKKKTKLFDRLVTTKLMKEMMRIHVKEKFPVYRSAMPFALPIFFGIVLSILFGNLMLLIV